MSKHETLSFTIEGKTITDIAREHFYVRNDLSKALDLLCAGLQSDQLDEYQRIALALRVLDGKAEIRGTYPGDSYGLYDLEEPNPRFNIANHISKLSDELESTKKELHELQMQFSIAAEQLTDIQKREANQFWFQLDSDHKRPIFEDVEAVPSLFDITTLLGDSMTKVEESKTSTSDYGWLEPSGTFHEVDFAEHETWAYETICERGWKDEYNVSEFGGLYSCGDFLVGRKGFVLLHNPGMGIARVDRSEIRPLTKAQREFLFDYYIERNLHDLAKKYLEDE